MDLVCKWGTRELTVRTKLVRDQESLAVCIAESVSHALLSASGFRVAEPFCVEVGEDFARDLTAQYGFDTPVRSGRHWGTRLMRRGVQEVEFDASHLDVLAKPRDVFRLYLADVILGNPDRQRHGNVLLAHRAGSADKFDLLPIDQSEAFFHPSVLLEAGRLRSFFDRSGAQVLEGTDMVVAEGGLQLVEESFAHARALEGRMGEFVGACSEEWLDLSGVDSDLLEEFLEHRVAALDALGREEHWLGVASITEGGAHALNLF